MNRLGIVPLGDINDLGIVVTDNNSVYVFSIFINNLKKGSFRNRENLQ